MNNRVLGCKIAGCGFGLVMLFSIFMVMLLLANDIRDKQNVKNIELDLALLVQGLRTYASDHQGKLPPISSATTLKSALYPTYVRDDAAFVDHVHREAYQPNLYLSEKTLEQLSGTPDMVAVYQSIPLKNGVHWVGFLSGEARMVKESDWLVVKASSHIP